MVNCLRELYATVRIACEEALALLSNDQPDDRVAVIVLDG